MDLHEIEHLMKKTQYQAPDNFTQEVMKKIHLQREKKASAKGYFRMGVSFVAAGLIVLFLNITPLMDYMIKERNNQWNLPQDTINPYRTADSIEYFTLKADSLLLKPFQLFTNQMNKEDF